MSLSRLLRLLCPGGHGAWEVCQARAEDQKGCTVGGYPHSPVKPQRASEAEQRGLRDRKSWEESGGVVSPPVQWTLQFFQSHGSLGSKKIHKAQHSAWCIASLPGGAASSWQPAASSCSASRPVDLSSAPAIAEQAAALPESRGAIHITVGDCQPVCCGPPFDRLPDAWCTTCLAAPLLRQTPVLCSGCTHLTVSSPGLAAW